MSQVVDDFFRYTCQRVDSPLWPASVTSIEYKPTRNVHLCNAYKPTRWV